MIRRRTEVDRAIAHLRRLNEPRVRKPKAVKLAPSLRAQVEQEFKEARRLGR